MPRLTLSAPQSLLRIAAAPAEFEQCILLRPLPESTTNFVVAAFSTAVMALPEPFSSTKPSRRKGRSKLLQAGELRLVLCVKPGYRRGHFADNLPTDYFLTGLDSQANWSALLTRPTSTASPFFTANLIAWTRLPFVASKDLISFSGTCTSGSGAGQATADVAAHCIKSAIMIALHKESLCCR